MRQEKHRAGNGTKDHKTNKRRYLEIIIKKKKLRLQNFILVLYIGAVTPIFQFPPRTALLNIFRRGGQVHLSLLFKATIYVKYSELLFTVSGSPCIMHEPGMRKLVHRKLDLPM